MIITPIVALAFRTFVATSGRDLLADEDILRFLLSPIGLACLIVVGGLVIGAVVLEQAVLLRIVWASEAGRPLGIREAVVTTLADTLPTVKLGGLLAASVLLVAAPYVAGVGLLYWMLLTGHDINYYLADKPPVFWVAVVLAGVVLAAGGLVVAWWLVVRVLSIPILVVRRPGVREAIARSRQVTRGHLRMVAEWLGGWLAAVFLIPPLMLAGYLLVCGWLVHRIESLPLLTVTVGALLALHIALNVLLNLAAVVGFALIVWKLWKRLDNESAEIIEQRDTTTPATRTALATWNRRRVAAAAAVAVLLAAVVGATSLAGLELNDNVQTIAHRGGATYGPENSLAAIRQAIADRADWVEIDVQETSDGEVAVVHDRDLKRVAGEAVNINESTLAELQSYDIGSPVDTKFAGERVPTLADVLKLAKGKVGVVVELKHYGHNSRLEERVVEIIEDHEMEHQIMVISLDRASIAKIRKLRPDWPVGLLTAVAIGDLTKVDADLLAVNMEIATSAFIARSQVTGHKVAAWTVNDRGSMNRMISRNVDYVITDDVPLATEVIAERADMSLVQRWVSSLAANL